VDAFGTCTHVQRVKSFQSSVQRFGKTSVNQPYGVIAETYAL
jgi:cbb3-type cytochrome oxidase cytochrome c subunit